MLRKIRKKKQAEPAPSRQQALVLPLHAPNRSLEYLTELIRKIRPSRPDDIAEAELKFQAMLYQVSQDRSALFSLRKALLSLFLHTNIVPALTESGIVSSRGFVQELTGKLKHKLLPELMAPSNIFYSPREPYFRSPF